MKTKVLDHVIRGTRELSKMSNKGANNSEDSSFQSSDDDDKSEAEIQSSFFPNIIKKK